MDEDQQLAKEAGRGAQARAILESALFKEAIQTIEDDTVEKWKRSPIRDEEGQLRLRLKWQIIQEVKQVLTDVLETGKLAETQIEQKRSIADRLNLFRRRANG